MNRRFLISSKPPTLMLTSLLDMFTIILIFLIVSFEAESYDFRLNPDLKLPQSSANAKFKPAVNVAITDGKILVSDKEVARLQKGEAAPRYHEAQQIDTLVEALRKEYTLRYGDQAIVGASVGKGEEADEANEPIVVLQADHQLNYRTLYLILRSAAQAGFFKYRLAVIKS